MPGLFSTIFESDEGGRDAQSSSHSADAGTDTHVDPSVSVELASSGSYETPDGTTHSWERTDNVTLGTDTHVVTQVSAVLTDDTSSSDF